MNTNILPSGSVLTIDQSTSSSTTPSTSSEVQDTPLAVPQIGAPSISTVSPTASIETGIDVEGIDLGFPILPFSQLFFSKCPRAHTLQFALNPAIQMSVAGEQNEQIR
jgi:hypothetical protein